MLVQDIARVTKNWTIYQQVYQTSPDRVDKLNAFAPAFFGQVQQLFQDSVILALARLMDPASTGSHQNLSLHALLQDPDVARFPALQQCLQKQIKSLVALCTTLEQHRNKRIAHRDLACATKTAGIGGVTSQQVDSIVSMMHQIVDYVSVFFEPGEGIAFAVSKAGDDLIGAIGRAPASKQEGWMYGQQIMDLYRETVRTNLRRTRFDASSRRAFRGWQRHARTVLTGILGALPTERVPFDLQREVVGETDVYVQERIVYRTRPGLQVPAYLFTPKAAKGPTPTMLCLHGHSAGGKDDTLDPQGIYAGFTRRFAEQGLVVLAPDQINLGERKLPQGKDDYDLLIHGLNMVGQTVIGWRYWDLVRALDLLETLPLVDRARIGVMGLSLGGEMTMFLSALQTRVRAACICGYLTSHLGTFLHEPHCTCGALRDLALHFEHVDIAALIAPRPLFVDSGRRDPMFHTPEAEATVRELRPIYDLFAKPWEHLGIEVHDGEHQIAGVESIPWMIARLRE